MCQRKDDVTFLLRNGQKQFYLRGSAEVSLTWSVHFIVPTKMRESVVWIRRVLFKRRVRYSVASALLLSMVAVCDSDAQGGIALSMSGSRLRCQHAELTRAVGDRFGTWLKSAPRLSSHQRLTTSSCHKQRRHRSITSSTLKQGLPERLEHQSSFSPSLELS